MFERIILTPFQKFVKIESFSGILLIWATLLAIVLVNSPFSQEYESFWNYRIGIDSPDLHLTKPLILWVNDGLMVVFFFLIGLEIKRELLIGELNTVRKALFPLVAALGGMLIPVALFFALNKDPGSISGWGIPMATDIAFTLAILKLLGNRVPLGLKVFLTAFAIIDDIGAVLVIAVFYSTSIRWGLLLVAMLILLVLYILSYRGMYYRYFVVLSAFVVWYLFLKAGIHPTVAGILMAFAIPVRQKVDVDTYTEKLCSIVDDIKKAPDKYPVLSKEQIEHIDDIEDWTTQVQSPVQHLEHRLHNWVAYLVLPVFALSNAGIAFTGGMDLDTGLILSVALSLVLGKFTGITLFSYLGVRLGIAELPDDVNFRHVAGVGFLAGIGFTMSIFISTLAFAPGSIFIDSAKFGILAGSLLAAISGYSVLRFTVKKEPETG